MSRQIRALVVDDSRSARLVLGRMLEKYDLAVDTAASAAQALEYLKDNRPDVIFMDHMMPGMDGLEAVKAIKNNPDTATIPVLMYTSKGGDLYLGQARALGAVGVLPKTVAPAELFDSLQRLGLVEERRGEERPLGEDEASERASDIRRPGLPAAPFTEPGMERGALDGEQLDQHLRHLLEEQRTEIRKDFLLSIDTVSRNTGNRFQRELDDRLTALGTRRPAANPVQLLAVAALAILLLVSIAWNASLHFRQQQARPAIAAAADAMAAGGGQDEQAVEELRALQSETVDLLTQSWESLGWAMNQSMQYPYDQIALDRQRVDVIEALLARLAATGFSGTVVVESHAGEFCLLGNEESGFRLPPPDLPVDQCEFIGNPVQPSDSPASHQSLRFANFLGSTPLLSDYRISLDVTAASRSNPLYPYPERSADTSAQTWNLAADRNNRVLVRIEPR